MKGLDRDMLISKGFCLKKIKTRNTCLMVLTNRSTESVFIVGMEQTFESCQRSAPHRMLQIVTSPVKASVFLMITHIRTVVKMAVLLTSRQTGNDLELRLREEIFDIYKTNDTINLIQSHLNIDSNLYDTVIFLINIRLYEFNSYCHGMG